MLTIEEQLQLVNDLLGQLVAESRIENGALLVYVEPADLRRVLTILRDHDSTAFNVMTFMTAVDYKPREPRFEVVYELYSIAHCRRIRVKCKLADTDEADQLPEIDSVAEIYLSAEWHERECYDLMGIRFKGHPDLRRILLPDNWDGHPLRKEYPFDGKRVWKLGCTVREAGSAFENLGL